MYCVALGGAVLVSLPWGRHTFVLAHLKARHGLTVKVCALVASFVCFVSQVNNTVSTATFSEHVFFFFFFAFVTERRFHRVHNPNESTT